MALRQIRIMGDKVLEKKCREVTEVTPRIRELIQDMLETMYDADGVGLAAPQVGILRRIVVIDVGEGPIVMINPEILETEGSQTGSEGCLSLPGQAGTVTRPNYVKIRALDENMEESSEIQVPVRGFHLDIQNCGEYIPHIFAQAESVVEVCKR